MGEDEKDKDDDDAAAGGDDEGCSGVREKIPEMMER